MAQKLPYGYSHPVHTTQTNHIFIDTLSFPHLYKIDTVMRVNQPKQLNHLSTSLLDLT